MGGPPLDLRIPASSKVNVTLVLSQRDNTQLLSALQQGKPSCMELTVTLVGDSKTPLPSALSMWVKAPDGTEGRLLRPFRPQEPQFRVQVLAQHTLNFKVGFYLITIDGGVADSRVQIQCRHSISNGGAGGGWIAETVEQQRDRLLAENRELQLLVEKQKEFILILKRKFLEKGDQLTEAENAVLEQKQKRVKFIINTWRMKTIVPTFQAWRKETKDKKARKKELLGKVIVRLGNSQLWRAWRLWVHMIESYKVGGLKAALATEKGKRARALINAWRMRSMTPVFEAWKKYSVGAKDRKRQLMGKVVARMQNAGLWQAFRHWTKLIEAGRVNLLQKKLDELHGKDRRARIESFLLKWRGKTIIPKFQAWRRYAHEHRGRKRILMGKVVLRLGNAKLWSAWRQWKKSIEDDKVNHLLAQLNKHKFARAKQLIDMWRMRSLTPAFKAWKLHVQTKRGRKKQLMGKVVARMQNAQLWQAFRQWSHAAEQMKIQAVQHGMKTSMHAQKKRRIQALMARWQKGTIVGTFKRWRDWSKKNRARKRELLGKVVRRMASANLWQAYRQWKKYAEHARLDEMRDKIRNELMATMMTANSTGGRGGGGSGASGDYQALLAKYRSLKNKKLTLETSYDALFKFLQKFRVQIARNVEEEITRLTHQSVHRTTGEGGRGPALRWDLAWFEGCVGGSATHHLSFSLLPSLLSPSCKCDVCQTKRKMLSSNGINEWLHQFDREVIKFRFPG